MQFQKLTYRLLLHFFALDDVNDFCLIHGTRYINKTDADDMKKALGLLAGDINPYCDILNLPNTVSCNVMTYTVRECRFNQVATNSTTAVAAEARVNAALPPTVVVEFMAKKWFNLCLRAVMVIVI